MKKMIIALAVIIALSGGIYGATLLATPTQKPVEAQKTIEPISVAKLHELVNAERVSRGIAPLVLDERLNSSACEKANWSNENTAITHSGYETFIKNHKQGATLLGENLAQTNQTSRHVVESWMESPTHRENLLEARYTSVGYCVVDLTFNYDGLTSIVQHFTDN